MNFTIRTYSLVSDFDGTRLEGVCVAPEAPYAIVLMAHGMAEHKNRYLPFMEYLAKCGFACFLHDHRGHGKSAESTDKLGYFGKNGAEGLVKDLAQASDYAAGVFPNIPLYLFGHSMGSLAVRCYLKDFEQTINGLIVCGTPAKNPAAGPGKALCKIIAALKGEKHRSALLQNICTGPFDKPFAHEGIKNAWLSRDIEVVKAYNNDPLCGFAFTVNGYGCLMELMGDAYRLPRAKNPRLPVHFISGEKDPCHGGRFMESVNDMKKQGWGEVTYKLYPDMRHEILNEIGKEQVWQDIYCLLMGWLKRR